MHESQGKEVGHGMGATGKHRVRQEAEGEGNITKASIAVSEGTQRQGWLGRCQSGWLESFQPALCCQPYLVPVCSCTSTGNRRAPPRQGLGVGFGSTGLFLKGCSQASSLLSLRIS